MVTLIGKISRGSRMDQIYLPKSRPPGFAAGDYVEITPTKRKKRSFFTYNVGQLEPVKNLIKDEIFDYFENVDNVLVAGSFLEKGFDFNDIDIILIGEIEENKRWPEYFQAKLGIKPHFLCLDRKSLLQGMKQDPLFQMMISKYLARKRELFIFKNEYNYKLLDLHLLESKTLIDNFEVLTGREKYRLVRNLMAIKLFLGGEKLSRESVDKEIGKVFGRGTADNLKENMVEKAKFLKRFKELYYKTFQEIMNGVKNEPKQK